MHLLACVVILVAQVRLVCWLKVFFGVGCLLSNKLVYFIYFILLLQTVNSASLEVDTEWPIRVLVDLNGFHRMITVSLILGRNTLPSGVLRSLSMVLVSCCVALCCALHDSSFSGTLLLTLSNRNVNTTHNNKAVTKEEFVSRVINMQFAPPLGGPYLAASAATIEDESAAASLFDILAGEKEKLTKHRMGKEMKSLANGEEGLTWANFSAALGAK